MTVNEQAQDALDWLYADDFDTAQRHPCEAFSDDGGGLCWLCRWDRDSHIRLRHYETIRRALSSSLRSAGGQEKRDHDR